MSDDTIALMSIVRNAVKIMQTSNGIIFPPHDMRQENKRTLIPTHIIAHNEIVTKIETYIDAKINTLNQFLITFKGLEQHIEDHEKKINDFKIYWNECKPINQILSTYSIFWNHADQERITRIKNDLLKKCIGAITMLTEIENSLMTASLNLIRLTRNDNSMPTNEELLRVLLDPPDIIEPDH